MNPARSDRRWLFVLAWSPSAVGGVSQVVLNMIAHSEHSLGFSPMLVVNDWSAVTNRNISFDPCPTFRARVITPLDHGNPVRTLFSYLLRLPGQLVRLRRLIRRERIDVINPHFPDLSALTWLLAARSIGRRVRPRVVLAFHGQDAVHAVATGGLTRTIWKLIFRLADDVVACSEGVATQLLERFRIPAAKVTVVDNGIDADVLAREAAAAPAHQITQPYILSLGTFEPKKGHDTLIKAFEAIQPYHPDLQLVLAGRAGTPAYMQALQSIREGCGAANRIHFLQDLQHGDAMGLLARARAFALASRVEPFGIAILEAMALGKPVVVTQVCGIVARFGTESFSATVPPDDAARLALALERVLADLPTASAKSVEVARLAATRFSWPRVLENWPGRQRPRTETSVSS